MFLIDFVVQKICYIKFLFFYLSIIDFTRIFCISQLIIFFSLQTFSICWSNVKMFQTENT